MVKTLLLYDGKMSSAERIANRLSYLIGNAKVLEISEAPEDLSPYGGFCFVFQFYGAVTAGKITSYLRTIGDAAADKRIAMVGIGFSDLGFMNYVVSTERAMHLSGIEGYFLSQERQVLRIGTEIRKMMQRPVNELDPELVEGFIEEFIEEHNTLALATSSEDFVRCTPLEYLYLNHTFYVITEGGNKFRGIIENGRASASIFDSYTEMEKTKGLQILAEARILALGSEEYLTVMAEKGITPEMLDRMTVSLFVIKLTPFRYEYLDTALEKEGYDARQFFVTEFQKEMWKAAAAFQQSAETPAVPEAAAEAPVEMAESTEATAKPAASKSTPEEDWDDLDDDDEDDDIRGESDEMSAREARAIIQKVAGSPKPQTEDEEMPKASAGMIAGLEEKITRFLSIDDDDDDDDFEYDGSLLDDDDEEDE